MIDFGKAEVRFKNVRFERTLPYIPYIEIGDSGVSSCDSTKLASKDALTVPHYQALPCSNVI